MCFSNGKITQCQSLNKSFYLFKCVKNRGSHLSCALTREKVLVLFCSPTPSFLQRSKFTHQNYLQAVIFQAIVCRGIYCENNVNLSAQKGKQNNFSYQTDFRKLNKNNCRNYVVIIQRKMEVRNTLGDKFNKQSLNSVKKWKNTNLGVYLKYCNSILKT